jgi:isoamylase/glycogen operon protein
MLSQGIPMLLMGDEYTHTRHGNNNTWCQDNELNWFLWNRLEFRPGFFRFFRSLIHFRHTQPLLRNEKFLTDKEITWHGITPGNPAWNTNNHLVAFSLNHPQSGAALYVAFNASHSPLNVNLPVLEQGKCWHSVINTYNASPEDFIEEGSRTPLTTNLFRIHSYSAIVLQASPTV